MLWGGSEGGEPSGGLGPGGGELELDLDDNSCHDDGVGPGRGNAVTVGPEPSVTQSGQVG